MSDNWEIFWTILAGLLVLLPLKVALWVLICGPLGAVIGVAGSIGLVVVRISEIRRGM